MIAALEALAVLAELGTMTQAATRLRVTQSAVSKRIRGLEDELDLKLIEPVGRRVVLTESGRQLVARTQPLLTELRQALSDSEPEGLRPIVMGVSESILASWGPSVLAKARKRIPGLELHLNAHRSPVALDGVRSGEYAVALVAGWSDRSPDLAVEEVGHEAMVIVPSGLRPLRLQKGKQIDVLGIEAESATGRALRRGITVLRTKKVLNLQVTETLQSFAAIVQMARHDFGHGLVPLGIAKSLGVGAKHRIAIPAPGLSRPITLVARPTTFTRPGVVELRTALRAAYSWG